MISGVRVTLWMTLKHLFGFHSEYVYTEKFDDKVYWKGGFICAVCGKKSQPIKPTYTQDSFERKP